MANATFSSLPTDITPNASKAVLADNYLNFHGSGGANWSQQYLPELYAQEVERYGNRSVSSFLRMVGAEMPMASDQVIWSEQGRLHLAYENATVNNDGLITIAGGGTHAVRVGQTIVLSDLQTSPTIIKCYVNTVSDDGTTLTVLPYVGGAKVGDVSGFDTVTDNGANKCSFFVYGSEFIKGSGPMAGSVTPNFSVLSNKPIILKDRFEISGSDTAQIGWVEVSGESGVGGYLWYLKAEGDTRMRFEDYLEMAMIEAVKGDSNNAIDVDAAYASVTGHGISNGDAVGSEGLFSAIESRGIVAADAFDAAGDVISDFDLILKQLDKQGAIEENMLFLNRDANLILDDGLANVSAGSAGGTAFGVFENSEDMALNLGFRGFRRGSYDFYKTDWKYMNNPSARGLFSDIKGVLVPAGTSSVYDQQLGQNIRRPFLHVRYRASQADDRKMKSWITGSVGGATASGDDVMQINYLSERCLVVQAANNFVLFK
tara:strand:+ start:814 stop:2274 length:1461 start_codon:yes stop_codon:yes gene_type:complete